MSSVRIGRLMKSTDGKRNARQRQERLDHLNSTHRTYFPTRIMPSRIRKPLYSQHKSSLTRTIGAHESSEPMSEPHHSPPQDQGKRPELHRGTSVSSSSSSSIQTISSYGSWSTSATTPDSHRRSTGYFAYHTTSGSPNMTGSRIQLPSLTASPTGDARHPSHFRINQASGLTPKSAQIQFFSWENLPSKDLLARCFSAFWNPHSLVHIICPFPEAEAWEMLQQVLAAASKTDGSGAGKLPSLPSSMNSRLCQVLLVAAVGSQHITDDYRIDEKVSEALFHSGKWYLDVMFGRDAEELHKFRANVLAALYSIISKSIGSKEHLDRALVIGQSMGLHHLAAQRGKKVIGTKTQSPHQPVVARTVLESSYGPAPHRSIENSDLWRKAWQGLIFLDGYVLPLLLRVS
ncbi:hypothetical protein EX30DRAFT_67634 [Ascodesmis nigricans]|uniref:Transcription factor domain-containing protein n=1 Tax=Ascodesmis nigricans TaxID=341454 RepID=A0A4S2MU45_9PEZI|nr:hypothetical protein EX30DRAFT_67634 [Ascodesmis nigricans]